MKRVENVKMMVLIFCIMIILFAIVLGIILASQSAKRESLQNYCLRICALSEEDDLLRALWQHQCLSAAAANDAEVAEIKLKRVISDCI